MKKLQAEFQMNADMCGLHTFKQIKRTSNTAIYQRIRKDGTTHTFEVFKIKIVKAGTVFAKGATPVAEDYESYPGKSAFGKYAYSCKTLEHAERRFDELLKSQENIDTVDTDDVESEVVAKKDNSVVSTGKGKRGRKAKPRSSIKIPKDKFTIKQLELLNPDVSFALLYQHVRGLLNIEFKIVEMLRGKRGKPTIVYAPMDLPVVNTEFKDVVEQKLNS